MINLTFDDMTGPRPAGPPSQFDDLIGPSPVAKTEAVQGLAALAASGQAGGTPSIYSTFYANRHFWIRKIRAIYVAQAEIDLLSGLHKLSMSSWIECQGALRFQLRSEIKDATDFGLLLFLVD
jgi:hypothetical protein